jgi:beta-glucosidase/6-phospho-beta-glucosidase/beta-galactosidase
MRATPDSFLWGAATASYQVEGGITNNDWDFFASSESIKKRISSLTKPSIFYKGVAQVDLHPAGDAVRAWEPYYYLKDFDMASKLGMNAFRIGIEWARIEPEKDQWDQMAIDHYRHMIISMREKGLMPIITLNHLTLPTWILTPPSRFTKKIGQNLLPSPLTDLPLSDPPQDDAYWKSLRGWENEQTVKEFVKFVSKVVQELKDQVDFWITITEPVASIIGVGYIAGLWPPGFFLDGDRAKKVLHNLIEAHVQAYDRITSLDDVDSDGDGVPKKIGFSHLIMSISPASPTKLLGTTMKKNREAAKNFDYFINDYFINAVVNGEEDLNYLNTLERHNENSNDFHVHDHWKNKVDFIGIDYYRHVYIYYSNIVALSSAKFVGGALINDLHMKGHRKTHRILNDLGWRIYPEGLYNLIIRMKNQGKNDLPILITENGVADKNDRYRAPFIVSHLKQVKRAIDKGANVIGYLHWSFMDNYEWLDNYRPEAKFGLFSINRKSAALRDGQDRFHHLDLSRQITKGAEALELIIKESRNQNKHGVVTDSAIEAAQNKFGSFSPDGSHIIYT